MDSAKQCVTFSFLPSSIMLIFIAQPFVSVCISCKVTMEPQIAHEFITGRREAEIKAAPIPTYISFHEGWESIPQKPSTSANSLLAKSPPASMCDHEGR